MAGLPCSPAAGRLLLLAAALALTAAQPADGDDKPRYVQLPLDGLTRSGRSSLGLVPFPRVGKRSRTMGLVPFPRVGRAQAMGLVPFPRVGRAMGLVPFPRVGRGSMGLVPFPRVGRLEGAVDKRQSLIPYPRVGKKSVLEEMEQEAAPWTEDEQEDLPAQADEQIEGMSKRANWEAPRLGDVKRSAGCRFGGSCSRGRRVRSGNHFVPRLGGA
ncbi:hypothetical protein FJT64_026510 [Amphibalanus amphitrite]|uniref:Uncharacterized protein n=1 Tax=Amphibalanus amphitrite TaxID=1232801 RepID=A0A6A4W3Z2_AMPAM|nr:hypothetical protein FJT64_026510 [Amphibalanus amphitrite]